MTENKASCPAQELLDEAARAAAKAYAPYSRFRVGAALLGASGKVYTGVNVENASYPCGICAERAALSRAVTDGEICFKAIAIASLAEGEASAQRCVPCGMCRQALREFVSPGDFPVYMFSSGGGVESLTLEELLPDSFV